MDLNEQKLNEPVSYTPNIDEYLGWLKEGIAKFKKVSFILNHKKSPCSDFFILIQERC